MSATTPLENDIINHLLRTATWTKPTTVYVGLFTAMPTDAGSGGTEVSGGSYARILVGVGDAYWDAPVDGVSANASAITFATPTATWGTVVGAGLFYASSGGTPQHITTLENNRDIQNGDPAPKFLAGEFGFTVD